jgi:hypothetical protein
VNSRVLGTEVHARIDHIGIEVNIPRPNDRAGPLIDSHLLKHDRIAQRRECRSIQQRRDVNVANLAVGENDTDRMSWPWDHSNHFGCGSRLHSYIP